MARRRALPARKRERPESELTSGSWAACDAIKYKNRCGKHLFTCTAPIGPPPSWAARWGLAASPRPTRGRPEAAPAARRLGSSLGVAKALLWWVWARPLGQARGSSPGKRSSPEGAHRRGNKNKHLRRFLPQRRRVKRDRWANLAKWFPAKRSNLSSLAAGPHLGAASLGRWLAGRSRPTSSDSI